MTQTLVLMLAFVAANLPWLSNKLFYCISIKRNAKHMGWCMLELMVFYCMVGAVAIYAENVGFGQIASQGWEFYAVTTSLFVVFAFPGFVYRILWK